MRSALSVSWDGHIVGQLTMDEYGDMGFAYDPAWLADARARPISRSLPLRTEAFDRRETRPFFAGLLPEETVRTEVARVLGLSKGNDFAPLKALGGDVASAVPRLVKDRSFLLVSRYDRTLAADGRIQRLHQEDFCQALAIPSERKYAAEGGPTFKTSFALLRDAASRPAIDVLKLLDAVLFNLIADNADAHGKNFSLLYPEEGTTRLAPLYDLMCTAAYPDVEARLAMKIAETSEIKDFKPHVWGKFAADIAVSLPYLRRRTKELAESAQQHAEPVAKAITAQGFDSTALSRYAGIVLDRAKQIAASL